MCNWCCCVPLGCIKIPVTIEKPVGYPDLPEKMLCARCGNIDKPVYRRINSYCGILFVPCIPCGRESPFMACGRCNYQCGTISIEKCTRCNITTSFSANYCPNCGTNRPDFPVNKNALTDIEMKSNTDDK